VRDVSATAQLAQSALPEPLRILASSLGPASVQVQTGASNQGVPATNAAIAIEIASRANEGSRQFDIRLDPPELGRIDVRLDVDKSGEVSTRLTVDRPETLSLLQNDARGLERALQSAGLKTEDGSLQFSLRQQSPDGSAGQQAQGGTDPHSGTVYVEEEEPASAGLEQYQRAAYLRGGVDIRV
jgi:flagellar hook-length control protein FliK